VKEQKSLVVVLEVEAGRMIGREAAEVLGLSLRQVRRLIAAYRRSVRTVPPRATRPEPRPEHPE